MAALSLTAALAVLAVCGALFTPTGLLVFSIVPTMLGLGHQADIRFTDGAVALVIWFPVIFALGALERKRPAGDTATSHEPRARDRGWLMVTLLFVVPLVALHFWVVGVAVFSDSTEVQRFALNSGFGGLPSRVVLFVLPILTLSASIRSAFVPLSATVILWGLFVGSRLAMGFKSGLLEVLIVIIVVLMLKGVALRLRSSMLIAVCLGAALAYANWVGSKYSTISSRILSVDYLMDRLGRQTAEAALGGLSLASYDSTSSFFWYDLQYFAHSYVGIGNGPLFAVDQLVSASISGTPLAGGAFIVPVTIGGPTYVIGSLGGGVSVVSIVLVMAAFFGLGRVWRRAISVLAGGGSVSRVECILAAAVLLGMRSFVVNGGGAYVVINYAASTVVALFAVELCGRILRKGDKRGSGSRLLVASR